MRNFLIVFLLFMIMILVLWLLGTFQDFAPSVAASGIERSRERAVRAGKNEGDIVIGLEGAWSEYKFQGIQLANGIEMAVAEINSSGGVMKRKLKTISLDNRKELKQAKLNAQKFSENLNVVAVIGDLHSEYFTRTAVIYRYNGIVSISTGCAVAVPKDPDQKRLIFSIFPGTAPLGDKIAKYTSDNKINNVMIYNSPDAYGQTMANSFEHHAFNWNVSVVTRSCYPKPINAYVVRKALKEMYKLYDFESIFIAGEPGEGALIVNTIREMKIKAQFLGTDALDFNFFLKKTGANSNGTVIVSIFDRNSKRPEVRKFITNYKKRYGCSPDTWAAQAYDCVNVLVNAMKKAKSTVPEKIAEALMKNDYHGVANPLIAFDNQGQPKKPQMVMKKAENGKFVPIKE